jgi:FHA domain/Bacterial regulatory protein, Fis family
MNEHQAFRITGTDGSASRANGHGQVATQSPTEYRSGVFAKSRRDASGGWGLVTINLGTPASVIPLSDGAVVGSASKEAKIDGPGVAPEHVRVNVRSDGCYLEDIGSLEGTFVGGVRAHRIGVMHGDVVRLGQQLAVFVERDLVSYAGAIEHTGTLVHGPRQRKEWIDPILDLVKGGSSVCIEGSPGVGKRTLAKIAGALREGVGETLTLDGKAEENGIPVKPMIPQGARPATWILLNADKLPRQIQLEITHSVGRSSGVSIIATTTQPLDRAASDGDVAPWFASLFSGKRVAIPSLEARREDIPLIIQALAEKNGIPLDRISPEFVEAMVRSGWPRGVPQVESVLVSAANAALEGPLTTASIVGMLSRSKPFKPSLPPSTDPALARARLEDALARANGSVASAARSLGMSRQAIYREADRLGLDIARRKSARS